MEDMAINQDIKCFEFDSSLLPIYFRYLITGSNDKILVETRQQAATVESINLAQFNNLLIPLPPLPEQRAIASFLDEKTTKIDRAITQKEKLIALLKERKQIIIQNAVTKGLDPGAKMKDSGVDWIGEIPEGWGVVKFKFIIRTKARLGWKGLKADEYVDHSEYKFLSTPNIKNTDIEFENAYHISQIRYEESPEIMLQVGDVLLVKDGSTLGISNLVNFLPSKCTVNSSIAVLRILDKAKLQPEYLNYFIKSKTLQRIIEIVKDGMGVPHLFQSDINNFSVPLPSAEYQLAIVRHIETQSQKIDASIALQEKQIVKLKEYKAVLIDGAVTGKIKVDEFDVKSKEAQS
jgi:type I restriction enzyme S subunit